MHSCWVCKVVSIRCTTSDTISANLHMHRGSQRDMHGMRVLCRQGPHLKLVKVTEGAPYD